MILKPTGKFFSNPIIIYMYTDLKGKHALFPCTTSPFVITLYNLSFCHNHVHYVRYRACCCYSIRRNKKNLADTTMTSD